MTYDITIETARSIVAEIADGTVYEEAPRTYGNEESHAWAAGVEYGMAVAAAIAAADAGTAAAPSVLRKTGTVELNRPGSGELFEITQADVTFSGTNDVTRRQELNIVLVLERDLPPRDSGIRTSARPSVPG